MVKVGDVVLLAKDPWLYGEMLVVEIMPDKRVKYPKKTQQGLPNTQHGIHYTAGVKWIACLVNPNAHHRRTERFYPAIDGELVPAEDFPMEEAA